MSMSVRDEETGLEWAGALGASGLFPTRANLRNPRYLRMLTEIPRFHRMAKKLLAAPEVSTRSTTEPDETLEQFLERGRFTDFFVTYFMTPLVSAVWSTDPDHALDYPARYLFRFLEHHGMLTVFGSPTWRTVTGGSREYVERVAKNLHEVRLSSPVSEIREHDGRRRRHRPVRHRDVRRRRGRHPPRPGAGDARRAHAAAPRGARRDPLPAQRRAAAHRRAAAAAGRGRPRLLELPAPRRRPGAGHLRHDPAAETGSRQARSPGGAARSPEALDHREAPRAVPGQPGRRGRRRPEHRDRDHALRAPRLHPGLGGRAGQAAAAQHGPRRLRRRLPRLGLPRGRRALRPPGGRSPRRTLDLGRRAPAAGADAAHLRHRDQARAGRAGAQHLQLPQPHLAGRPRRPAALHGGLRAAAAPAGVVRGPRPRRRPRPQPAREHRRLPRRA